jgi:2-methylcitrate dehydratase PrpD
MELDIGTIKQALGIAEYHAPNLSMERDLIDPAMVKHGHGWAAMTGIVAAELADRGFTGIPGLMGFEEFEDWISSLGDKYMILDAIGFKQYCSCGWGHMAIAAAKMLQREYDWNVEDIAAIRVEGHHWTAVLHTAHPTTTEEAQFSVKWPLAAYLIDGVVGPDQILEARLDDARINALVDKIELVESEKLNDLYRPIFECTQDPDAQEVSRVVISLKDGRTLDSGLIPGEPWPETGTEAGEIEHKFRWLTRYVLEEERIEPFLEKLWHIERVQNIRELTSQLRRR